jgi:hypothetical protein
VDDGVRIHLAYEHDARERYREVRGEEQVWFASLEVVRQDVVGDSEAAGDCDLDVQHAQRHESAERDQWERQHEEDVHDQSGIAGEQPQGLDHKEVHGVARGRVIEELLAERCAQEIGGVIPVPAELVLQGVQGEVRVTADLERDVGRGVPDLQGPASDEKSAGSRQYSAKHVSVRQPATGRFGGRVPCHGGATSTPAAWMP